MGQILGYWLKAPLSTMTNSLFRQRSCIENLMRAALSLPPSNHMFLLKHVSDIEKIMVEPQSVPEIIPNEKKVKTGVFPEKQIKRELYAA